MAKRGRKGAAEEKVTSRRDCEVVTQEEMYVWPSSPFPAQFLKS